MQKEAVLLQKERNSLLSQWEAAKQSEKTRIIVRIMDIDEMLEIDRPGRKKKKKAI
ncbi:MAG: hypothetical protein ACYC2T_09360 [Bacillota bacterium]